MPGTTNVERHIACFTCICDFYENYLADDNYWFEKRRYWCRSKSKWDLQLRHAYQFISSKSFLKHHESKHDSNKQPIRLLCKKCLQMFTEPGAAEKHALQIPVEYCDELSKFVCNQCPNECFLGKTAFLNHASSKHKAQYDSYNNGFDYRDAWRLKAPNMSRPADCMFWSWTGRNFSPFCCEKSFMKLAISPGCNYVPNWPYTEIYGCGLCSYLSDHKVRVRNHLKFKHSVLKPDARIKRYCERSSFSSGEEEINAENESPSECNYENFAQQIEFLSLTKAVEVPTSARRGRRNTRGGGFYCYKLYRCKTCSRTFDSKPAAFQHADKSHPFRASGEFFPYQLDDFCCSFCSRQFGWASAAKEHEKKLHSEYLN